MIVREKDVVDRGRRRMVEGNREVDRGRRRMVAGKCMMDRE
jgi:hypothetical protein